MRPISSLFPLRAMLLLLLVAAGSLTAPVPALAGPPEAVLHTFNSYVDGYNPYAGLIQGKDGNFYGTTYQGGADSYGTVFKLTSSGALTCMHNFTGPDGEYPSAALIQGKDGNLYGTTAWGGVKNSGTVFEISTDGSTFITLHSFDGPHGANPSAALIQDSDGNFYGTTYQGGSHDVGAVFKLTSSGTLTILHNFNFTDSDGAAPHGGVIQGNDGNLYGTTSEGGSHNEGTVFKISTGGKAFKILYSFGATNSDGAIPYGGVIQGKDGNLYGTTTGGGTNLVDGTVFEVSTDGSTYKSLHSFGWTDGRYPTAGLIQGKDGNLYGTTQNGGANYQYGSVFKISTNGATFTTLHSFDGNDGESLDAGVIQGSDGNLYGTTYGGAAGNDGTVFEVSTNGTTFTLLYDFSDGFHDGWEPSSSLTLGADGNYYGTTISGGLHNDGTVFEISADGTIFNILHSFNGNDGDNLIAGLIQGKDGNFYGTTAYGGTNDYGTVFKISANGATFTTLHNFDGTDGEYPSAALIQSKDGNLYGTTIEGGAHKDGTVFKISTNGATFTTLHSFDGNDGANSIASLIQGSDSNLYGTTSLGGASNDGTVFLISANGKTFKILHSFNGNDGNGPSAGVIQGSDGNLYGTTEFGGANDVGNSSGDGTVFEVSRNGSTFKTLHSFNYDDGAHPIAGVIQGSDGNLYGTTPEIGADNVGTVFEIGTNGTTFLTLHNFVGSPTDGANPSVGLVEGLDGNLYGTTIGGGIPPEPNVYVWGTVFQLQTQLPFKPIIASFSPAKVNVGAVVTVTGLNLAEATSVTINGVAQTITSDSANSLKFKVTTGTTTGPIVVTTPKGSGSSSTSLIID